MHWRFLPPGALLLLVMTWAVSAAHAAVFTWDGGGGDNNLSTPANWSPDGAPPNNGTAELVFSGPTRTTPNVDGNWSVLSVAFGSGASAFTIGGSQLTIGSGGVTNSSTNTEQINNSIILGAAQSWSASAGNLILGSTIDTGGFGLTIMGGHGTTMNAAFTSSGSVHVATGSTTNLNGSFSNSGSLLVDSGASVTVSQAYTAAGSITNNGFIGFGGDYTGTTAVAGTGSTFFNGILSTGAGSTASLNFPGSATINNEVLLRLAGHTRGSQYDAVIVSKNLTTNGVLQVTLSGGFMPAGGDNFDLFDWYQRDGAFDTINLPALGAGLAWSTLNLYSAGTTIPAGTISVVDANLIPGDANHDGKVDVADVSALMGALADLSKYQNNRGLTPSQLRQVADLNQDGSVNNRDLQALLGFLAQLSVTGSGSVSAVPEPPAFLLGLMATFAAILWRKSAVRISALQRDVRR